MSGMVFRPSPVTITPDLRRAAEYHVGHALTEAKAGQVIDDEMQALVKRFVRLGRWIRRMGEWQPPTRPRGVRYAWKNAEQRVRLSTAMKASWARRRAKAG